MEIRRVSPGNIIFTEGSQGDPSMFVIKEGKVEISIMRGDRRVVLATLEKNQFFGEMALISSEPRSATAKALTYCELQVIGADMLESSIEKTPLLVRHLLKSLVHGVKRNNEQSVNPASEQPIILVYARLLNLLGESEKSKRGLGNDKDAEVTLLLSKVADTFHNILGHSESQASVILREMSKIGLLRLETIDTQPTTARIGDKRVTIGQPKPGTKVVRYAPEDVLSRAQQLPEAISHKVMTCLQMEQEMIDIDDLANLVGIDRQLLLRKISQDDLSDELFAFRKSAVLRYVEEKGRNYFAKRPKLSVDQIEFIGDLEFVSQRVLFDALNRLDIIELAKLLKHVEAEAIREKMFSVMAKNKRQDVEDLMADVPWDPLEAEKVEAKLIEVIKQIASGDHIAAEMPQEMT